MNVYLGVDVGSVSTNIAILDSLGNVLETLYIRTQGKPVQAVQQALRQIAGQLPSTVNVQGVGTTGSGRILTSVLVGADTVKNEITAHAVAALHLVPNVRTVLEIGGQDSKIIILRDGVVIDFAMNTVCAAGTGAFLDQQAARLNTPIEEFGLYALQSTTPVRIAGRCAVFAESDMIHKQQTGHSIPDIINGLCEALVRNYINNVGRGKDMSGPVVFQGGVAANIGIRRAFEQALGVEIFVPQHYGVMGAIGAALLAKEETTRTGCTFFRGFAASDRHYQPRSFECQGCANLCEVVEINVEGDVAARWGDRCGKWNVDFREKLKVSSLA
jgi:predicted CoA-substrate-specific enzyme activase